jgi:hypothetical protein
LIFALRAKINGQKIGKYLAAAGALREGAGHRKID